ncbi:MAG: peptide chain release factor 2 [Bradymonadales bacterium]|nr:peptide chain release factor 2 [Bradymonadales bacterium]
MLSREELREKLTDLEQRLFQLRGIFEVAKKTAELEELEHRSAEPGFWEDPVAAQEVMRQRTRRKEVIDRFAQQESLLEDAKVAFELAEEEEDASLLSEAEELAQKLDQGIDQMELERMFSGEHDRADAIVSINAGAGGTDSQDWAEMLLRMYLRYCELKGWKTEITDILAGEEAGIKNATFTVEGSYAYGMLRAEVGIHRLVRISPFNAAGKRQTSFASVFVIPQIDDSIAVEIDEKDLRIDTYRSSGAGGQHVNKTDSAVRITHLPTGIVIQCQNERSQHKNRHTGMKILRARLYELELSKREEQAAEVHAAKTDIAWGHQIRSYVLHPYRLVKDLRTGLEIGNVDRVLDGEIEPLIQAYLLQVGGEPARS